MEKQSIAKTYFSMWRRIFDYKGTSEKREYWVPFVVHLILIAIDTICLVFCALEGEMLIFPGLPGVIILAFLLISIIPWIALCVRTVRTYGGKIWWKFLLFFIGVGALIFNLFLFIGAAFPSTGFVPGLNEPVCVYGPPPGYESDFDPSGNIPDEVYGPPAEEWDDDEEDMIMVESNIPELVYGPPEVMGDPVEE